MDQDLRDNKLKLVRRKVLFIKRGCEVAFAEGEELVADDMDPAAYTAWKLAEFLQDLAKGLTDVPRHWQARGYPPDDYVENGKLIGLPDEDKKYLRLYFEVLERYPRETLEHEKDQARILRETKDRMQ